MEIDFGSLTCITDDYIDEWINSSNDELRNPIELLCDILNGEIDIMEARRQIEKANNV